MWELNEQELEILYKWIDDIPLSRPKKNIWRDFSDGVLVAETIYYFFPNLVDLHNYMPVNSTSRKKNNWEILNRKVLSKLNCPLSDKTVRDLVSSKKGTIEQFLWILRKKLNDYELWLRYRKSNENDSNKDPSTKNCGKNILELNDASSSRWLLANGEEVVPANIYKKTREELYDQRKLIKSLKDQLSNLQQVIGIKKMQIEELSAKNEEILYRNKFCCFNHKHNSRSLKYI